MPSSTPDFLALPPPESNSLCTPQARYLMTLSTSALLFLFDLIVVPFFSTVKVISLQNL